MKRQRLDKALVTRDLARSRSRAKELIENDRVLIDGFPAQKPSTLVEHNDHIELRGDEFRWVGRGGRKIWPFIENGWIDPGGRTAVDVGSSTGGFTQTLLRAEAERVYAVDVGYGQLDDTLRNDERVEVMDRYNFRHAESSDFPDEPVLFTMDVSFISTIKLLDALNNVMASDGEGLVLLKPQFEAGPDKNENGIVKDKTVVENVLETVSTQWLKQGWGTEALAPSALKGRTGNQEYVAKMVRRSSAQPGTKTIETIVQQGTEWVHSGNKS